MANKKYTADKNGVYSTLVWDGTYTDTGRKHRKQLRSKKSSADLEKQVNAFKEKVAKRQVTKTTDILFTVYAKTWLDTYKDNREDNTKSMYRNIIEKHFNRLRGIRLDKIGREHLQAVLNNTTESTGRQAYITFKQVIKSAITDRYLPPITLDDIFSTIKCPSPPRAEKRALTEAEKKAVKQGNYRNMDKAFLYIIYGCGLRRGEVLALTKSSIDLDRGLLHVNRSVIFKVNEPKIKPTPKTENGVRTIPMPPFLTEYLKSYMKDLKGDYLFYTRGRDVMTKSSYDKMWARIKKEINRVIRQNKAQVFSDVTAHTFRHNYCSSLCYQVPTISIKHIAQLIGDTQKVVLDVYNHIILEKEDAAKAVENAINF